LNESGRPTLEQTNFNYHFPSGPWATALAKARQGEDKVAFFGASLPWRRYAEEVERVAPCVSAPSCRTTPLPEPDRSDHANCANRANGATEQSRHSSVIRTLRVERPERARTFATRASGSN
jgi:hypothetical protein